ncbi:MAG: hypothetical protein Q4P71_03270 [Actinomycetaceae bacterium]|nr:hypothetical protein [Actinomycetaceae bacterium]
MTSSYDKREALRGVFRSMRERLPVNKFPGKGRVSKQMPRIDNPVIIGGLGAIAAGGAIAVRQLRPFEKDRRDERLQNVLTAKLVSVPDLVEITVDTHEAFGKPALVTATLTFTQAPSYPADLLDRVLKVVWDHGQPAPVGASVVIIDQSESGAEHPSREGEVLDEHATGSGGRWTLTELGYADEVARPHDLYDRYGAPASDPTWKP